MEWVSGQHFPWRKKKYLLYRGALVPDAWKERDKNNIQLQTERGTISIVIARVVACDDKWWMPLPKAGRGDELCTCSQSTGRDAWSTVICCSWPRMTLGWLEPARARWVLPETAQAWGWCQTLSCSYWIPVACTCLANCSLVEDVPCLESKCQSQELKAKYNTIKST